MTQRASETVLLRVRPRVSILRNAFVSILLGTSPILGVAYYFASSRNLVWLIVLVHTAVITLALLTLWRQLNITTTVTNEALCGNSIFGRATRMPLRDIRQVVLARTYLGASQDPRLQLLAIDHEDRCFRFRGSFWNESDLRAVAAALPVALTQIPEPVTMREFYRAYPRSTYWFENRRALQVTLVTAAILIGILVVASTMLALGLPVRFL